jgi:uncharacterized membrane protein
MPPTLKRHSSRLALAAVPLGWLTIHLMAAIHYAHLFWQPEPESDRSRKGLVFPERCAGRLGLRLFRFCHWHDRPDIGRCDHRQAHARFHLAHAIISFFFNTVLVAAAVNLAVSLGN